MAQARLDELFTRDGRALRFWFDGNLSHHHVKRLSGLIADYGGVVRPQEDNLDVIIVSENFKDLYERKYWSHPDIYVELPSFINDCIYKRKCEHNMPQQRPMGGSLRTGKNRVDFTKEDQLNLCKFLARVCPDKSTGGRFGNVIYKRLELDAREYGIEHINGFGSRHTWQAWREHYKKHQDEFDPIINVFAKQYPANHPGLYELNRNLNGRKRLHHEIMEEEEEEEEVAQLRNQRTESPQPGRVGGAGPAHQREEEEEGEEEQQQQQAVEENEDQEGQGDEWDEDNPIVIDGDDGWIDDDDPIWANRKLQPDEEDEEQDEEEEQEQYEEQEEDVEPPTHNGREPQSVSEQLQRRNLAYVQMPTSSRFPLSQATLVNPTQSDQSRASDTQPRSNVIPEDLETPISHVVVPPRPRTKRRRIDVVDPPPGLRPADGPAQNTRARSQSVEPNQRDPLRGLDKGKQRAKPAAINEEEDDEEEEVDELLSERAEDEHDDEIDSDDERSHRTLFPRNSEPVRNDAGQKRHLRAGAVARASSFHPLPGTEAARVSRSRR